HQRRHPHPTQPRRPVGRGRDRRQLPQRPRPVDPPVVGLPAAFPHPVLVEREPRRPDPPERRQRQLDVPVPVPRDAPQHHSHPPPRAPLPATNGPPRGPAYLRKGFPFVDIPPPNPATLRGARIAGALPPSPPTNTPRLCANTTPGGRNTPPRPPAMSANPYG